jgi:hypothetical protein
MSMKGEPDPMPVDTAVDMICGPAFDGSLTHPVSMQLIRNAATLRIEQGIPPSDFLKVGTTSPVASSLPSLPVLLLPSTVEKTLKLNLMRSDLDDTPTICADTPICPSSRISILTGSKGLNTWTLRDHRRVEDRCTQSDVDHPV